MKQLPDRNVIDVEAKTPWGVMVARGICFLVGAVFGYVAGAAAFAVAFISVMALPYLFGWLDWLENDIPTGLAAVWPHLLMLVVMIPALVIGAWAIDHVGVPVGRAVKRGLTRLFGLDPHAAATPIYRPH